MSWIKKWKGKTAPAITLHFKGYHVSYSKEEIVDSNTMETTRDHIYIVANEKLLGFRITGEVGGRTYTWSRNPTDNKPYFDPLLRTYTLQPVDVNEINDLVDSNSTQWKIDINIKYLPFFYYVLKEMTSIDQTFHNLALPVSKPEILSTISTGRSRITYKEIVEHISNIPLRLVDKELKFVEGKPAVKLMFEMVLPIKDSEVDNDPPKNVRRKLMAMDYCRLLEFGKGPLPNSPSLAQDWYKNVLYFLVNHSNFKRGEIFKTIIFNLCKNLTAEQISTRLRDGIDKRIITANHWADLRENRSEAYQRDLSNAFGSIHKSHPHASPVNFFRAIEKWLDLNHNDSVALILQYGVGYCKEHAQVSYEILSDILKLKGSSVKHVVFTGNANIKHAFVIYNLEIFQVISTKVKSENNKRFTYIDFPDKAIINKEIKVWNLKKTINVNQRVGNEGYVMDPYLDPTRMPKHASELLQALNSHERKRQQRDTDFLIYIKEIPTNNYRLINKDSVKNI